MTLLEDVDREELRRRENANPAPTGHREFRCPTCGARCTRLTDGQREAGHGQTCPRRLQRTGTGRRLKPESTPLRPGFDDATPGVDADKEVSQ